MLIAKHKFIAVCTWCMATLNASAYRRVLLTVAPAPAGGALM